MAEVKESSILIQDVETKNIMTKSTLPVGGYSVNPYVGCTHGCKYCYASFMKRFTGHTEPWGTFLDVKHWPAIKNPQKYKGQRVVIGSVTDGYLPQEAQFQNTRKLLEQLRGSEAEILICTKSDLVIRDIDLLKELGKRDAKAGADFLKRSYIGLKIPSAPCRNGRLCQARIFCEGILRPATGKAFPLNTA